MRRNDIVINGLTVEIILANSKNIEIARTLVDLNLYDNVKDYRWYHDGNGYAKAKPYGKVISLHRIITNASEGVVVDHINHDTLDNRRQNLRLCTAQENARNRGLRNNNTSGFTGVTWKKRDKKWQAQIKVDGKVIHLGYFTNMQEAIRIRKDAEDQYFREFAYRIDVRSRQASRINETKEKPCNSIYFPTANALTSVKIQSYTI